MNLSLEDILSEKEEENSQIKLISFPKNQNIENEQFLTKPSFKPDEIRSIICPKCQQYIIMEINDYKIFLSKCKNGHIFNNINLQDFNSTQKYEEAQKLLKEKNIIKKEDIKLNEIKEEDKNSIAPPTPLSSKDINENEEEDYSYSTKCEKHKMQQYSSYCLNCKKNLCSECEMNHNIFRKDNDIHKIVHFYEILSNNDEYLEKLKENIKNFRHKIDLLKIELSKLTNIIK